MPTLHIPFLIVLLLLPNTSWRDWHASRPSASLTPLQSQIARLISDPRGRCAIAVMNARTADTDKITFLAGARTLLAGARLRSTPHSSESSAHLGYSAMIDNLPASLAACGISVVAADPSSIALIDGTPAPEQQRGKFVLATLAPDDPSSLAKIDFWKRKVASSGSGGELILASPNPSAAEYQTQDQLTPILFWHPSPLPAPPALLYSPSTRAAGLIAGTDVASTIAALADVPLIGPSFGSACGVRPQASRMDAVSLLNTITDTAARQAQRQKSVPYLAAGLAILIVAISFLVANPRATPDIKAAVWSVAAMPLILMVARSWETAVALWLAAIIIAVELSRLMAARMPADQLAAMQDKIVPATAAITLIYLTADTALNHARFSAESLLGCSPLEGARYYGLGNEAMGTIVGGVGVLCARIIFSLPSSAKSSWTLKAFYASSLWLAAAILLADPRLGAKAGSIPVVAVGLLATLRALNVAKKAAHSSDSARPALPANLLTAAALIGLVAAALFHSQSAGKTHVSVAIQQAHRYGPGVYGQIAMRKLAMDAHLVLHSVWMLVLLATVVGSNFVFLHSEKKSNTNNAIFGIGIPVTLACLLFNDAGVVAAALCSCFLWSSLLSRSSAKSEITPRTA